MRFVASLALRSVRARRGTGLAAAIGIAAAAAVLVVVLVGAAIARDRSIDQSIERLPEPSRSVRAIWFGVPSGETEEWGVLDRSARAALAGTSLPGPTSVALVRESTIAGRYVGLAAVDGLAPYVDLQSGRMPRRCRPDHCEVLRLRGVGRLPDVPELRLVEVGRASLRSRKLFGDFLEPSDNALGSARLAPVLRAAGRYHSPPPGPLVVAEGVAGLVASPELARSYRSYAWVAPLGDGVPRAWDVRELLRAVARARTKLDADSTSWSLADPRQELLAADRSVTVAGRRLALVGGEGVALLVAFALLAAGGIRHELERARRRLTWSGATRGQTALLGLVESALIGFGGTLVGVVVGSSVGAIEAASAGSPVWETLRASVLSLPAAGLALALGVAATLVVWAAASLPRSSARRVGLGEVAAGAGVLVLLVALLGGPLDTDRLARGGGAAVLLLMLPGVVALVAAVGASRLAPAVARPLARSAGRPALRIAATSVARRVGLAGVAVAFLALAVGLALFAETYRSTLSRGERDVAAFAVPASFTVHEDLATLVPVLDAAPLDRFEALARPGVALPVTRMSASAGRSNDISGVSVLALPGDAIRRLGIWRDEWGSSRDRLASLVDEGAGTTLRGVALGGEPITLQVGPTPLGFRLTIVSPDGRAATVGAPAADTRRPTALEIPVPAGFENGRLVAIELVPPRIIERGADAGEALRGTLALTADGLSLGDWIGVSGATARAAGDGLSVDYILTPQRHARLRPVQPTDSALPTVAATPALAELAGGVGGVLPLKLDGELVDVRVGAVIDRFPGVTGELVVGNDDALTTAIATVAPGVTRTNEIWLDVPAREHDRVAKALADAPFRGLRVSDRRLVEDDARRDPLGHGTLLALGASSIVALILAVIGLALAVRGDLRDDRGELVDLEAQGASPALLRRSVRLRALLVFGGGLVGGMLAGMALAALTARVIQVTARAGTAEPPLATVADPLVLSIGLLTLVAASAVTVALVSRHAFADPRGPGRVGGSG